jgi:hypothetical protein
MAVYCIVLYSTIRTVDVPVLWKYMLLNIYSTSGTPSKVPQAQDVDLVQTVPPYLPLEPLHSRHLCIITKNLGLWIHAQETPSRESHTYNSLALRSHGASTLPFHSHFPSPDSPPLPCRPDLQGPTRCACVSAIPGAECAPGEFLDEWVEAGSGA